jgi:hypothetical protein
MRVILISLSDARDQNSGFNIFGLIEISHTFLRVEKIVDVYTKLQEWRIIFSNKLGNQSFIISGIDKIDNWASVRFFILIHWIEIFEALFQGSVLVLTTILLLKHFLLIINDFLVLTLIEFLWTIILVCKYFFWGAKITQHLVYRDVVRSFWFK